jgi:hypothetical protein
LIHWVSDKLYWASSDHKENALFRSVLSQVLESPDGSPTHKKSIVIDNYRIHFAKPVFALLAAHSDDRLLEAVTGFFQDLATRSDMVRSVAGLAA